jgi:hypothetical protein
VCERSLVRSPAQLQASRQMFRNLQRRCSQQVNLSCPGELHVLGLKVLLIWHSFADIICTFCLSFPTKIFDIPWEMEVVDNNSCPVSALLRTENG